MILFYVLNAENKFTEVTRRKTNFKNPLAVSYENTDQIEEYIKASLFL